MSLHLFRFVFLRSELCFEVNNYTNTSSEKVKRFFDTAFTRATQKKGTRSNDGGSDDSTWLEEAIAASRSLGEKKPPDGARLTDAIRRAGACRLPGGTLLPSSELSC